MARPLRVRFDGAWYHIMNRGASKKIIYHSSSDKHFFLELLAKISKKYQVEIHAYCLMNNHYHLIMRTPVGFLSEAMRQLGALYTQRYNYKYKKDGPLFRGRFKAILVSEEEYLLKLSRYIHRNPIEAGLVKQLKTYSWSSYPAYIGINKPASWLKLSEIKKHFAKRKKANETYQAFVEQQNDEELREFYDNARFLPVLGDENYLEKVYKLIENQSLSNEITMGNVKRSMPSLPKVLNAVANYYNMSYSKLCKNSQGQSNNVRVIAMIVCQETTMNTLKEIGKQMGGVSYASISMAIKRFKLKAKQKKEILEIIQQLQDSEK